MSASIVTASVERHLCQSIEENPILQMFAPEPGLQGAVNERMRQSPASKSKRKQPECLEGEVMPLVSTKNESTSRSPEKELLLQYAVNWPESFPGTEIDKRSNNHFRWRTIQNMRCKGGIPAECFVKVSPRKVLIFRDAFLKWFADKLNSLNS